MTVQFGHSLVSNSLWPCGLQHNRLTCPSLTPELTQTHVHQTHDAIQPTHPLSITFSSCIQSFPASGSFLRSQFFPSGGQRTGVSASASVLPMNIQDWFPWGLTGWVYLQLKELSRATPNTTVQKHQFFSAQLSFCLKSHIHTWLLGEP